MSELEALTRAHQLAQIRTGGLAALTIGELGNQLSAGKISLDEFTLAGVGVEKLGHQSSVNLAADYMRLSRRIQASDLVGRKLEVPPFQLSEAMARAVSTRAVLERGVDDEFWAIVGRYSTWADRAVKQAGRDLVVNSASAAGSRWRRVSDGSPCAFCAMLVGRGPVYGSAASAAGVVGRGRASKTRGSQALGSRFHDHCGCTVEEVPSGVEWAPTETEQKFADLYEASKGGDVAEVTARMRQLGSGVINDATAQKKDA